jgi:hypothetical protein
MSQVSGVPQAYYMHSPASNNSAHSFDVCRDKAPACFLAHRQMILGRVWLVSVVDEAMLLDCRVRQPATTGHPLGTFLPPQGAHLGWVQQLDFVEPSVQATRRVLAHYNWDHPMTVENVGV